MNCATSLPSEHPAAQRLHLVGASASGGDRVVITAGSLDAHQGPNASSPVVFTLSSGAIVEAAVRAGAWIQVRDDQGRTGWVSADGTLDVQ